MTMKTAKPATVDDYFKTLPKQAVAAMKAIRKTFKQHLPKDAKEIISYGIPAFKWSGTPLYYAGWTEHVSIYPLPKGDAALMRELKPFVAGKGTLKFMLNDRMPMDLIAKIAKARVQNDGIGYKKKTSSKKVMVKKSSVKIKTRSAKSK